MCFYSFIPLVNKSPVLPLETVQYLDFMISLAQEKNHCDQHFTFSSGFKCSRCYYQNNDYLKRKKRKTLTSHHQVT